MENRNVVIALVLMLAVWIGFTLLFPPPPPVSQERGEQTTVSDQRVEPEAPLRNEEVLEAVKPAEPSLAPMREVVVENDLFRAVLSSSGGRLTSLVLKRYSVSPEEENSLVSLVNQGNDSVSTLWTTGIDGLNLGSEASYHLSETDNTIRLEGSESRKLVFSTVSSQGITFEKIYTFYGDSYKYDLQIRIINTTAGSIRGGITLSLNQPWEETMAGGQFEFVGPVTMASGEVHTDPVEDLEEGEARVYRENLVWTGFEDKYFISAAIPLQGSAEVIRVSKPDSYIQNSLSTPVRTLEPGQAVTFDYLLYYGPRDLDILKDVNYQLAEAIDFGFFSPIARPLLHVLKFFYSYVGNYGLAIILLTVIIKLLFWPLTQKSYASMKSMQKLQPEMQKIREKFKNDRERLNRELMDLYKNNRVNPLGGCLPMLIQIPVFFALYKVLLSSIELRHAPFFLWIQDLSAKDPYYITPLIMGATMFIQQKMTPTTMDPTQAKLFMIMPVVFTFLFLNFPSGLVIYWLVNNVLTIAQQYYINKKK